MIKFQFHKSDNPFQRNRVLDNFHNEFSKQLIDGDIEVIIKELKKSPSNDQRGYLWAEIIKKILLTLKDEGYDIPANKTGLEYVYNMMKEQAGLYEDKAVMLQNSKQKKVIQTRVYESFDNKRGDKKKLAEFIDFCIRWGQEWFGIQFETPEDYKLKRGIK